MAFRFLPQTAQVQPCFCCSFILRRTASFSILTRPRRSLSDSPSQKSRIFSRSPAAAEENEPGTDGCCGADEAGAAFAFDCECCVCCERLFVEMGAAGGAGGLLMVLPVTDFAGALGTTGTADFAATNGLLPLATAEGVVRVPTAGAGGACAGGTAEPMQRS